jgi:hypothetical protein
MAAPRAIAPRATRTPRLAAEFFILPSTLRSMRGETRATGDLFASRVYAGDDLHLDQET